MGPPPHVSEQKEAYYPALVARGTVRTCKCLPPPFAFGRGRLACASGLDSRRFWRNADRARVFVSLLLLSAEKRVVIPNFVSCEDSNFVGRIATDPPLTPVI